MLKPTAAVSPGWPKTTKERVGFHVATWADTAGQVAADQSKPPQTR